MTEMTKKKEYKIYFECRKCGDKLPGDTGKKMTYCKCEAIAIDGCQFYTRIIGEEKDWKEIRIEVK